MSGKLFAQPDGLLSGTSSPEGRAFLGTLYSKLPVGPLRWRSPQPTTSWTAVRDATHTGSPCTQAIGLSVASGGGGGLVTGSEDCLYLNVYGAPTTKNTPRRRFAGYGFSAGRSLCSRLRRQL
ncbi:MAG: hypothetical protein EON58_06110 [Alphaproteobacteria bacterium]|nr:MAG: hypothetical protein EON58_06110 [Alphaproteobacteria bacterium]